MSNGNGSVAATYPSRANHLWVIRMALRLAPRRATSALPVSPTTQQLSSSYLYGDDIEIHVEVLLKESISRPNISFTIQEARLLVIGGANFALQTGPAEDGWRHAAITVRFPANLSAGRYHVTLKLLDGENEHTSQLIEKQVAPLAFDMLPNQKNFLGMVDLGLRTVSFGSNKRLFNDGPSECATHGD